MHCQPTPEPRSRRAGHEQQPDQTDDQMESGDGRLVGQCDAQRQ